MQGIKRKVIYVAVYEAIAIMVTSLGLSAGSDSALDHAGVAAIMASVTAITWNLTFNVLFEHIEARLQLHGRGLINRLIHAIGFEGGLIVVLVPLFAWWLDVSLWRSLSLNIGLCLFFMTYMFVYNWVFDRVFGLPSSVQTTTASATPSNC